MENNEILQEILKQLQTQNQMNIELSEALKSSQAINKQLLERQEKLQSYIETKESSSVAIDTKEEKVSLVKPLDESKVLSTTSTRIEPTLNEISLDNSSIVQKAINPNSPITMMSLGNLVGDYKTKRVNKQFSAFKTLMSSHISQINTKYDIFNRATNSFKSLKENFAIKISNKWEQVPSMNILYTNIKEKFIEQALISGITIQTKVNASKKNLTATLNEKSHNLYDTVFLFGEKRAVAKLNKNFSSALEMIGFKAEELSYDYKKNDYVIPETVQKNIDQKLSDSFKIIKSKDNYLLPALEQLNDETKAEVISKLIWPNMMKEIENSLGLLISINNSKNENKYFKLLNNFAKNNDITPETALHCLENQPSLLNSYKNHNALLENKDGIINNMDKYEKLSHNNFVVLQSLIKAATDIQSLIENLNIRNKEQIITNMANTKVANSDKKSYSFSTIQKNIMKLFSNKSNLEENIQANRENNYEETNPKFKSKFGTNG